MTPIAPHITAFLRERLTGENTRATYAYAFHLLFAFASKRLGVAPSDLQIEHLDAPLVLAFLDHIQHERATAPAHATRGSPPSAPSYAFSSTASRQRSTRSAASSPSQCDAPTHAW